MKTQILITSLLIVISSSLTGQENVLNGLFAVELKERPVPYPPLREADVMWSKRIWQKVDLREKINLPLYYPIEAIRDRKSLMQAIYYGISKNYITPYSALDDQFTIQLTNSEIEEMLVKKETITVEMPDGSFKDEEIVTPFESSTVLSFRIKEEWFFDKQRSVLDVRIIGICPVMQKFDANGEYKGDLPLFWIYFPESRHVFVNTPTFNMHNDVERVCLDDIFLKRRFSSYVYKESNVYDRKIGDYKTGEDILLESQKIKSSIQDLEQDLWSY